MQSLNVIEIRDRFIGRMKEGFILTNQKCYIIEVAASVCRARGCQHERRGKCLGCTWCVVSLVGILCTFEFFGIDSN